MKNLAVVVTLLVVVPLVLPLGLRGQVKGNQQIVTKTYAVPNLQALEMNLYAEVIVDASADESLRITADENLLDLIATEMDNGKLVLTQKEWIQPSEKIRIFIGGPNLERIQVSVHETVRVKNLNRVSFNAMAILGRLVLEGELAELSASGEIGEVDASGLQARKVNVNLWGRGKIVLGSPEEITGKVDEDGRLFYDNQDARVNVKTKGSGKVQNLALEPEVDNPEARFIKFQIKNNSFNRIQCYVKGPKPDGSTFSYGFPMNPGQTRDKDWSVGSKVYRVTGLGTRKLLVEIKAEDENQVVKLYQER
jgi:hypothetical protein